jgi:hypothetical protein
MLQVPLQAVANQQITTLLAAQTCQIAVYQKSQGLFVDLAVNGKNISTGILALNGVSICPFSYADFSGYLFFADLQGSDDPSYEYLGTRFVLIYMTEAELDDL